MADATLQITIPEAQVSRVVDALAKRFEIEAPNRAGKIQAHIRQLLIRWVLAQEADEAAKAARQAAAPDLT